MLLSWWCPFKIEKGKWSTRHFKIIYRFIPLSTPVSCRWTVPLRTKWPQIRYRFDEGELDLNLRCCPLPQELLQGVHRPQLLQPPSTAGHSNIFKYFQTCLLKLFWNYLEGGFFSEKRHAYLYEDAYLHMFYTKKSAIVFLNFWGKALWLDWVLKN